MMRRQTSRTGFTLIELLVVIAIIAILAAILFPVFARARAKSWEASCLSNMKQILLGVIMYTQDYDGFYPMEVYANPEISSGVWRNVYWSYAVDPYIKGGIEGATSWTDPKSIWRCPGAKVIDGGAWYGGAYSHYASNVRLTRHAPTSYVVKNEAEVRWPSTTMLITEGKYWHASHEKWYGWYCSWGYRDASIYTRYDHNGRANVGFCDGHAKGGTEGQRNSGEYRTTH